MFCACAAAEGTSVFGLCGGSWFDELPCSLCCCCWPCLAGLPSPVAAFGSSRWRAWRSRGAPSTARAAARSAPPRATSRQLSASPKRMGGARVIIVTRGGPICLSPPPCMLSLQANPRLCHISSSFQARLALLSCLLCLQAIADTGTSLLVGPPEVIEEINVVGVLPGRLGVLPGLPAVLPC